VQAVCMSVLVSSKNRVAQEALDWIAQSHIHGVMRVQALGSRWHRSHPSRSPAMLWTQLSDPCSMHLWAATCILGQAAFPDLRHGPATYPPVM